MSSSIYRIYFLSMGDFLFCSRFWKTQLFPRKCKKLSSFFETVRGDFLARWRWPAFCFQFYSCVVVLILHQGIRRHLLECFYPHIQESNVFKCLIVPFSCPRVPPGLLLSPHSPTCWLSPPFKPVAIDGFCVANGVRCPGPFERGHSLGEPQKCFPWKALVLISAIQAPNILALRLVFFSCPKTSVEDVSTKFCLFVCFVPQYARFKFSAYNSTSKFSV